jgi:light-regulated signal transduction histidine kinase (bacteriophytochrome)
MMSTTTDQPIDLTSCDREPIHVPGRVQPHGVLLVLAEPDLRIIQASTSTAQQLGRAAESLLGQPLAALLGHEYVQYLRNILDIETIDQNPLYIWTSQLGAVGQHFDGLIHRHNGALILELEPSHTASAPRPDFYRLVKTVVARLQGAPSFDAFCNTAVAEVRALTGFDRVMIYTFDADGHGSVIAEALAPDVRSFLGLHYPASDIPQQARALYLRNWLRLIPDARYTPADVVPTLAPDTGAPLDLSYATLRSVSPIHLEYLANMGVRASMSISIIDDGALWGLIACHHLSPRYLPYEVRAACEFLGQAFSLQLTAKRDSEDHQYRAQVNAVGLRLIQQIAEVHPLDYALTAGRPSMLDLIDAGGAALCIDGQIVSLGQTPTDDQILALIAWLGAQPERGIYNIASLATACPELANCKDTASGVLAAPISRAQGEYLLWFRPELLQVVNWGGEPTKAVELHDDGVQLHPRRSFELWQQMVALHARPWKSFEIAAASDLRNAVLSIVLRRVAELAQLNAELESSNVELDAFAYIASHDLKEPLRGLHNYAHFLIEDYGDKLDSEGQAKLQTLIRLTQRMEALIDTLLHYSRIGRVDLVIQQADLNVMLREVLDRLAMSIEQQQVQVRIPRPLPTIQYDAVSLGEVFYNLILNAIKYNTKPEKWVEIGYEELASPSGADASGAPYTFYVRDNGIGIQEKHFETIFRIFKRLHARDQFGGGTGAGLTIAKKIVERHGGRIWLESTLTVGTTFFFTIKG